VGLYKAVGNAVNRIQPEMQLKNTAIEEYGSFIAFQASITNTSSQLLANPTGLQLSLQP